MRWIAFLFTFSLTVFIIIAFDTKEFFRRGSPAIGPLLSPFHGFWQNSDPNDPVGQSSQTLKGLSKEVSILYDDRLVPHIFAQNEKDLYFAQGYVSAQLRLWQMDIQTRAAGGFLAEVLGPNLVPYDRFNRRIGMLYAAKAALSQMEEDSTTNAVLQAYTAGVNAYIDQLSPTDYPLEYKLLDFKPSPWTPLKTALLLKYMAWDLTGTTHDFLMSNAVKQYGSAVMADLFPNLAKPAEPIIPDSTRWDFNPEPTPNKPAFLWLPDSLERLYNSYSAPAKPTKPTTPSPTPTVSNWPNRQARTNAMGEIDDYVKGSNNWVISGEKTASGYPILANDPHLGLTMPSIWLEMQLSAPGINVYGVTIPGAPTLIIGYNEHMSWGMTNTGADVLDWYRIHFNGPLKSQYQFGAEWRPTRTEIETIPIRGQAPLLDTVIYTHHGPVVYHRPDSTNRQDVPMDHAMRWAAHDPSNELKTFYLLNRARTYTHFQSALSHYNCPAQNFVYAGADRVIGIKSNGKLPLRWPSQGKFVMDGAEPLNDWRAFIARDQLPAVKQPKRGFVSSANQIPTDSTYPYYLNWDYAPFMRGRRINERLAALENANVDSLRKLQIDNVSLLAQSALPLLLKKLKRESLTAQQWNTLQLLVSWDGAFDANSQAATLFDFWWNTLHQLTWNDDFPPAKMLQPKADRTLVLLWADSTSRWFDDRRTAQRETRADIILKSYQMAHDTLMKRHKSIPQWGKRKKAFIPHIAGDQLKSLGIYDLPVGGHSHAINAMHGSHGPSWRMIVSLGPYVKGYGIYPGGQSGNPASAYYDDGIATWAKGELQELHFFRKASVDSRHVIGRTTLKPNNP
jgi:penicillin G amidase